MHLEFRTYFKILFKITTTPQVYVNAALVGFFVCYLTAHYTPIPFIVPLFVQILVRSNVKYRQRHQRALVELPAQTEDPAFIMDMDGDVILSIGKTKQIFERYGIENIKQFIRKSDFDNIIKIAFKRHQPGDTSNQIESFSNHSLKWYEIKAEVTGMRYGDRSQKILVWFQDITQRKIYQLRLKDLLRYSDSLMTSLMQPMEPVMEYELLAVFLLKEYEAAFITRTDDQNNLKGYAFKTHEEKVVQSDLITVPHHSLAPIVISRKEKRVLFDEAGAYESAEQFLKRNPFEPVVLDFIGRPVRNFITYNEADFSIIAFNFRSGITAYEKEFFEILVNIYRNMMIAVDLKKELQKTS